MQSLIRKKSDSRNYRLRVFGFMSILDVIRIIDTKVIQIKLNTSCEIWFVNIPFYWRNIEVW